MAVAQLGEDLGRVLTEERCRAVDRARGIGELHGDPERLDGSGAGMNEVHHHVARQRVRVGEGLGVAVDGPRGHAVPVQALEPVGARLARRGLLQRLDQRGAVLHAEAAAGEARVLEEVGSLECAAQRLEELVVVGAHGEIAVRGAQGLVGRREPVRRAQGPGRLARHPVLGRLPDGQRHGRLEERGVHELPRARALAVLQRAEDPVGGEESGAEVGERHARLRRRALLARDADDPAHALRDQVVAAPRRIRARPAETAHRAVDEPWVHGAERVVAEPQALGHAGPVVLDEDVGALRQPLDDLHAFRALEVHGEPTLAAVHRHERRAVAVLRDRGQLARGLARARRLDLDHVGAHVGEVHRAEGGGHGLGEVDDPDALERFHGVIPHPLGFPR